MESQVIILRVGGKVVKVIFKNAHGHRTLKMRLNSRAPFNLFPRKHNSK